jgi:outer membrane biosynthesis protein TonB
MHDPAPAELVAATANGVMRNVECLMRVTLTGGTVGAVTADCPEPEARMTAIASPRAHRPTPTPSPSPTPAPHPTPSPSPIPTPNPEPNPVPRPEDHSPEGRQHWAGL